MEKYGPEIISLSKDIRCMLDNLRRGKSGKKAKAANVAQVLATSAMELNESKRTLDISTGTLFREDTAVVETLVSEMALFDCGSFIVRTGGCKYEEMSQIQNLVNDET